MRKTSSTKCGKSNFTVSAWYARQTNMARRMTAVSTMKKMTSIRKALSTMCLDATSYTSKMRVILTRRTWMVTARRATLKCT